MTAITIAVIITIVTIITINHRHYHHYQAATRCGVSDRPRSYREPNASLINSMSWIDSMHSVYYWWIAKVINPTYQASGYIQDDSCRNMSYLCVHEVSSCETSHVWSYLRIYMHIDERYACMSKRTTHLYITRAMEVRAIDDHLVASSVILAAASSSESSAALS